MLYPIFQLPYKDECLPHDFLLCSRLPPGDFAFPCLLCPLSYFLDTIQSENFFYTIKKIINTIKAKNYHSFILMASPLTLKVLVKDLIIRKQ
jgi:hypothetical protein